MNLSSFDTSNVRKMTNMFAYCDSTRNLMQMFQGCSSLLEEIRLGKRRRNVRLMTEMFSNCESLKSVDMSALERRKKKEDGMSSSCLFLGCCMLWHDLVQGQNTPV